MKFSVVLLLIASCILITGCSVRLADYTIMSTKNISCQNIDITKCEQYPGVVGKDIRFWGCGSNIKNAADKALEQHNGNLLIDVVVYQESVPTFPLIWAGYVVKGTVVKVPYEKNPETK